MKTTPPAERAVAVPSQERGYVGDSDSSTSSVTWGNKSDALSEVDIADLGYPNAKSIIIMITGMWPLETSERHWVLLCSSRPLGFFGKNPLYRWFLFKKVRKMNLPNVPDFSGISQLIGVGFAGKLLVRKLTFYG